MNVRPGFYLLDHPPRRSQGRHPRRANVRPVVVVHTTESATDLEGPDPTAERVAQFIADRTTPGNYHLIGDTDSIVPMLPMSWEVWGDRTGSNRWAVHVSLAMRAGDWPSLPPERHQAFVRAAAWMFRMAGDWFEGQGLERPHARLLTKPESDRWDANGFISHARRDPPRRTDPGPAFPWQQVFDLYEGDPVGDTIPVPDPHMQEIQTVLIAGGYRPGNPDGIPGPKTLAAVEAAARHAEFWRRHAKATAELAALAETAARERAAGQAQ